LEGRGGPNRESMVNLGHSLVRGGDELPSAARVTHALI
jgi:hypothetical protein